MTLMDNQSIRDNWRRALFADLNWIRANNQAGGTAGEAGGFFVTAEGFPRRGYLKPTRLDGAGNAFGRAAREKIAADLAYELGLPVPPAVLHFRDGAPGNEASEVVVTLVMYPLQHSWESVRHWQGGDGGLGDIVNCLVKECAGMYAFDTWIGQTDHGDHPHNVILGYRDNDATDACLIFLDFAFSMGHAGQWKNNGGRQIIDTPFPIRMKENISHTALSDAVLSIEQIDDEIINEIVVRIPKCYLNDADKKIITTALKSRRKSLRARLLDTTEG